jgi:hypothetical protein
MFTKSHAPFARKLIQNRKVLHRGCCYLMDGQRNNASRLTNHMRPHSKPAESKINKLARSRFRKDSPKIVEKWAKIGSGKDFGDARSWLGEGRGATAAAGGASARGNLKYEWRPVREASFVVRSCAWEIGPGPAGWGISAAESDVHVKADNEADRESGGLSINWRVRLDNRVSGRGKCRIRRLDRVGLSLAAGHGLFPPVLLPCCNFFGKLSIISRILLIFINIV